MQYLCVILIVIGAAIMSVSIIRFRSCHNLLKQQSVKKLSRQYLYKSCLLMMIFFLAGYIANIFVYIIQEDINSQDVLISIIFFLGSIFVFSMVSMTKWMLETTSDRKELKKRLQQQELMSAISQSFTTQEKPEILVVKALKMAGEFMNVNHAFLSEYNENSSVLRCRYEWHDQHAKPFIGGADTWPINKEMEIYRDLMNHGYAAIDDYNLLEDHNFEKVRDYKMRSFLNIPLEIDGQFWGMLGFILYNAPYQWKESDIHLGRLIAGIFSGVIAKNEADAELIKAKEIAETASKSKSDFLSRMSHEMRTPMNMIIGMTNIGLNANDITRKNYCFSKVETASKHLLGVINDVLDMSKIEANKFELSNSSFNLELTLTRIISVISYQVEQKKQKFSLSYDKNIPPLINADELRITQVVTNLLSNAIKFTPDKGKIDFAVKLLKDEDEQCLLEFVIKDSGIGISKDQQRRLFQPFEQADGKITRKYGGTGLGLVISKRIIEMMQGKITIESEIGHGSKFIFTIVVSKKVQKLSEEEHIQDCEIVDSEGFENIHILVAEDMEINREIFETILSPTKINIDFAENGSEVYAKFQENPLKYDLIFMDIHMPEVDGLEATRLIRGYKHKNAKNIPIIAMTADVFKEDIEKCFAVGMNDHVGKPLDFNIIKKKIISYAIEKK